MELRYFTVSFTRTLANEETVTEYFYEETVSASPHTIHVTQNPMRYGGTIFHSADNLVPLLKRIRTDARFASEQLEVRKVGLSQETVSQSELNALMSEVLLKTLDATERRVLGIVK